jgi:hypothetical protein
LTSNNWVLFSNLIEYFFSFIILFLVRAKSILQCWLEGVMVKNGEKLRKLSFDGKTCKVYDLLARLGNSIYSFVFTQCTNFLLLHPKPLLSFWPKLVFEKRHFTESKFYLDGNLIEYLFYRKCFTEKPKSKTRSNVRNTSKIIVNTDQKHVNLSEESELRAIPNL